MTKQEIDMYDKVCKEKFEGLSGEIGEVKTIALKTHKAICESNGKPSILSRLDAIEVDGKSKGILGKTGIESRDLPRIIGMLGIVA